MKGIHTIYSDLCNMCGKRLNEWDKQEEFGFNYYVGYGSKYDLQHVRACFCCECFDKVLDRLIDECVIDPVVEELDLCCERPVTKADVVRIIGG